MFPKISTFLSHFNIGLRLFLGEKNQVMPHFVNVASLITIFTPLFSSVKEKSIYSKTNGAKFSSGSSIIPIAES